MSLCIHLNLLLSLSYYLPKHLRDVFVEVVIDVEHLVDVSVRIPRLGRLLLLFACLEDARHVHGLEVAGRVEQDEAVRSVQARREHVVVLGPPVGKPAPQSSPRLLRYEGRSKAGQTGLLRLGLRAT